VSQAIQDFIAQELGELQGEGSQVQFEGDEAAEEFPFMYWKKPSGEIYVAGAWSTVYKDRRKLGHTPLDQYGEFLKINKDGWNSTLEPWRRIFQHPNGASEFSVQQIRDMGWHKRAPYRGVVFPQLEGVTIQEFKCSVCGRGKLWSEHDLMSHETIAHKETSANNALARAIASAQKEGGNGAAMTEILQLLAAGQGQMADAIQALTARLDQVAPEPTPAPAKPGK